MKKEEGIERLRALITDHSTNISWTDKYWAMAQLYHSGKQWGYTTPGLAHKIRRVRSITDPMRQDVRVVQNLINRDVMLYKAMLSPKRLAYILNPSGRTPEARTVSTSGNILLTKYLRKIKGLSILRARDLPRCILGSVYIRRTLKRTSEVPVGDDYLRLYKLGWSVVMPWEVMRDPSACTSNPQMDEEIFCHFQPRTTAWVERNTDIKVESKTELGNLYDFHTQQQGSGFGPDRNMSRSQSKLKAVIWYECYFRDTETDTWNQMLQAYSDPKGELGLKDAFFGKNPYHGFPFHGFHFQKQLVSPWGVGIPMLQKNAQDINNIAWTAMLRIMQAGGGQIVAEKGTIDLKTLTNRIGVPLLWRRSSTYQALTQPPSRLQPPQMNPAIFQILSTAPQWMQQAINLNPVQAGNVSKRGESGEALTIRLQAADAPVEDIRIDDNESLNELLEGSFVDMIRHATIDELSELAAGTIPDEHLYHLKRQPPDTLLDSITALPGMIRPKTPGEIKTNIVSLVTANVLTGPEAQWSMGVKSGEWSNVEMGEAYNQQMSEIASITAGIDKPPNVLDYHEFHIKTLRSFVNSTESETVPPEIIEKITLHGVDHWNSMSELQQLQQPQLAPQQGSPPAGALEAVGPVGSEV